MSSSFLNAIQVRRTHYGLSKSSFISDAQIKQILDTAIMHVPSPFNCQSARIVFVTGEKNDKLWRKIVKHGFLKTLGDDPVQIKVNATKILEYAQGYGSILFFEDQAVLDGLRARIPNLKDCFAEWSGNSTGMLQFAVWTALSNEGLGASLQHHAAYSDEIATGILKEFDLPATWKCTAIMPFGVPTGAPGTPARPKTFEPVENRVKVFH